MKGAVGKLIKFKYLTASTEADFLPPERRVIHKRGIGLILEVIKRKLTDVHTKRYRVLFKGNPNWWVSEDDIYEVY
tara:strand:- start:29391 stop:29618 length:228 start_codon:yes stop_codon:yes gene_type:complete